MSLFFRSLPWVIPQVLLAAQPRSEVAIMSPWVADVTFDAPVLGSLTHRPTLSGVLDLLANRDIMVTLLIRDHDHRLNGVLRAVAPSTRPSIRVVKVTHTHTKAVVTERLALHSSANLLDTSLHRNRETPITLEANIHDSARRWLLFQQDIRY